MTCSCPKCKAPIEFDPAVIPAEGSFDQCSECHTHIIIRKDSFAKRALFKGDEISCTECGEHPGSSIYCQNCHAIYPDFLVIETTSATKKQLGKILSYFDILKSLKTGSSAKPSHENYSPTPSNTGKPRDIKPLGKLVQSAIAIATILILLAGGGYYWHQNKIATEYTQNYVKALLGIKIARDYELTISNRVANDMKIGGASTLTAAEKKAATSAKTDVDTLIQRIGTVPVKFTDSDNAIKQLNEAYSMLHATVSSPVGMSDTYSAAVKQMDDKFKASARTLKAALPEKISTQLAASTKKYKQLQDF